ncbi:MAG TPA: hypothetical protein VGL91_21530, partial [Acidobacteriota bacterium]
RQRPRLRSVDRQVVRVDVVVIVDVNVLVIGFYLVVAWPRRVPRVPRGSLFWDTLLASPSKGGGWSRLYNTGSRLHSFCLVSVGRSTCDLRLSTFSPVTAWAGQA